jgi:antitoxin CcdA
MKPSGVQILDSRAGSATVATSRLQGRKRALNISIDECLIAEAKSLGINISRTVELALDGVVRRAKIDRWSHENRDAIAAFNRIVMNTARAGGGGRK